MPQIKLHLINQTKFDLIFDYKNREYFVLFDFDKIIEVESGSLLYVHPEGKPDEYQQINSTMKMILRLTANLSWENYTLRRPN